jgi:hypothetical protein
VLLDLSRVGDGLSGEEFDEGRLSSSVGSDCERERRVSFRKKDVEKKEIEHSPIPTREERETAHEALVS